MSLLEGYKDSFSTTIPNELPATSDFKDHLIDCIPKSYPPNRPPHWVSCAQQEKTSNTSQ